MDHLYKVISLPFFLLIGATVQYLINVLYQKDLQKNILVVISIFGITLAVLNSAWLLEVSVFLYATLSLLYLYSYRNSNSKYLKFSVVMLVYWMITIGPHQFTINKSYILSLLLLMLLMLPFRSVNSHLRDAEILVRSIHFLYRLILVYLVDLYGSVIFSADYAVVCFFAVYVVVSYLYQKNYTQLTEDHFISVFFTVAMCMIKVDPFFSSAIITYLYIVNLRGMSPIRHNKDAFEMLLWLSPYGFKTVALLMFLGRAQNTNRIDMLFLVFMLIIGVLFSTYRPFSDTNKTDGTENKYKHISALLLTLFLIYIGGQYVSV